MTFAFPIWLVALLPWAGMVAYLLRVAGQRAFVPFLTLWPRTITTSAHTRRRLPPLWILLMCLSSLMAILASAGPRWVRAAPVAPELSIVIDRGVTMCGDVRYRALVAKCNALLGQHTAGAVITVVPVPGETVIVTDGSWANLAAKLPPTALDTRRILQAAVADQMRDPRGPVIVLTDQLMDGFNRRAIQVVPDHPAMNLGITELAAESLPHPQVMVRLRNDSSQKVVRLRVRSGTTTIDRVVNLTSGTVTVFIDLPALADSVSAEIESDDDIPADDVAWLARQPAGITLDVEGGIAPEVRRMAKVFMQNRPAGRHVLLSDLPVPVGREGIQVVSGMNANHEPLTTASAADTALTNHVAAWPGRAADIKSPAGFHSVVERNNFPLVAVLEGPPRQVWVNLDLALWNRTTDFVIFFSNVFEWIRNGKLDEFTSIAAVSLGSEWKKFDDRPVPSNVSPGLWPGLYRSEDDRMLAINCPPLPSASGIESAVRPALLPSGITYPVRPGFSLSAGTCCAALVCVAAALAFWPRRA